MCRAPCWPATQYQHITDTGWRTVPLPVTSIHHPSAIIKNTIHSNYPLSHHSSIIHSSIIHSACSHPPPSFSYHLFIHPSSTCYLLPTYSLQPKIVDGKDPETWAPWPVGLIR